MENTINSTYDSFSKFFDEYKANVIEFVSQNASIIKSFDMEAFLNTMKTTLEAFFKDDSDFDNRAANVFFIKYAMDSEGNNIVDANGIAIEEYSYNGVIKINTIKNSNGLIKTIKKYTNNYEKDEIVVSQEFAEIYNKCVEDIKQNPNVDEIIKKGLFYLAPEQKIALKKIAQKALLFLLAGTMNSAIDNYVSTIFTTIANEAQVIVESDSDLIETYDKEVSDSIYEHIDTQSFINSIESFNEGMLIVNNTLNEVSDVDESEQ